jgi:Raf kinase inhibitor-like YbhB/YbcL family protein
MKTTLTTALVVSASMLALHAQTPSPAAGQGRAGGPPRPGLTLTTPAFQDGSEIPAKHTQAVPNPVSPKLEWSNVPDGTQSFVLNMIDPDTALQRKTDTVVHWVAFNIPGTARELAEGVPADAKLADGTIQIKNQRGAVGFLGPGAPAVGPHHHYTWELYALDTKLDLTPDAARADVLKAIDGHILGKAILVGRFKRPQ